MKVLVLKSFGPYKPGRELHPPDGQANLLIRRGLVELVPQLSAAVAELVPESAEALSTVAEYAAAPTSQLNSPQPRPKPHGRR